MPVEGLDRLSILTNYVSARILEYIEYYTTYEEAIAILKAQYVSLQMKYLPSIYWLPIDKNKKKQRESRNIFQALKFLFKDSNSQNVAETEYR